MPSKPADSTAVARTSAPGVEPVGGHARARARGHAGDPRVVGVEDRDAAVGGRRQRLDELRLGVLDRLDGPDPRQVHRLDRGHDPDRRPADRREVADLAARVHAHLEDRGRVLRARGAGR